MPLTRLVASTTGVVASTTGVVASTTGVVASTTGVVASTTGVVASSSSSSGAKRANAPSAFAMVSAARWLYDQEAGSSTAYATKETTLS